LNTPGFKVEYFRSGRFDDVSVTKRPTGRSLDVDGVEVGGTELNFKSELGLAYFPRLLFPNARRVFVVGLGTGVTCGASLLFPQTTVVCAERESAAVAAAAYFEEVNHRPLNSSNFNLVLKGGRSSLKTVKSPYDLILLNYADTGLSEAEDVMTKQFYSLAKSSLTPEGILAQRLNFASFSTSGFAMLARTVSSVFPHCALVLIGDSEGLLLGSSRQFGDCLRSVAKTKALIGSLSSVKSDFEKHFGTTNISSLLVSHLWLDDGGIFQLGNADGETSIISDWDWRAGFDLHGPGFEDAPGKTLIDRLVLGAARVGTFKESFSDCNCTTQDLDCCHEIATVLFENGFQSEAIEITEWGLALDGEQPDLLVDHLILSREDDLAVIEKTIQHIQTQSWSSATRLGTWFWKQKQYREAVVVFACLTKLNPYAATAWLNLANSYREAGDIELARRSFQRAVELNPGIATAEQARYFVNAE
jgi:tetratricopeptide (TPR) repeat protein